MRKIGTILKTAAPLYVANLPEHHHQPAIEVMNKLLHAADDFNQEQSAASADHTLTPQGQALRTQKAAAALMATLTAVESESISKLTSRSVALEKSMRARVGTVAPKDAAHEMQLRETRDQLRQLSADERIAIYRTTDDPIVIAAIETAPPTLSAARRDGTRRLEAFVDPTELETAQMARAEAADPAAAATLREVRALAEVYRLAVNGIRQEVTAAGAVSAIR